MSTLFGNANHVVPQRLPLVLFVPHVRSLEQRHDQPLRLHEDHLRCSTLGFHSSTAHTNARRQSRHRRIARSMSCSNCLLNLSCASEFLSPAFIIARDRPSAI